MPIHLRIVSGLAKDRRRALLRVLVLFFFLYLFFVSIELLGASFKLMGRDFAQRLMQTTANPVVGLLIGVLATSLVQSSSTTTSMTVGLVAGGALDLAHAIPIIMGANIGTSVTNTLVSLAHIRRRDEFERAFAAATVHDFFNILSVLVLFPLQVVTDYLGFVSQEMAHLFEQMGGLKMVDPLGKAVDPAVDLLVWFMRGNGIITAALAILLLLISLRGLVRTLKRLMIGKIEAFFDQILFRTAPRAFFVGLATTVAVQSSSITTSLAVPLAGAGILTLAQIYPYTLGANVGTTVTAIMAALVTGKEVAVAVAFSHLLFNISGILVFWPLRRIPLRLAQILARISSRRRFVPFLYTLTMFFVLPLVLIYIIKG